MLHEINMSQLKPDLAARGARPAGGFQAIAAR
jgi:hypothetical protein